MGTTKSAVSRLESAGKHAPFLATLKRYARAVGCDLQVRLVPQTHRARSTKGSGRSSAKHRIAQL
ncbi:MAG: helix-turn-helix transcriptional regulator [Vicinamibacteria bacterium]|nr:helix-turn-helix transcriptional regulator [Vicinamibacteria bacterium]